MKNYNEIYKNKNEVANQHQQQKSQEIINEANNNTKVLLKCESNYEKFIDKTQQFKSQKIIKETNDNTKIFSNYEKQNSNNHYFRITGYCPKHDFCFIIDSNGMFEKLWQFSSYLISKGLKVLEVSNDEKFIDINIEKAEKNTNSLILRATADGKPEYIEQIIDGVLHKAIKVANKIYIPNK